MKKIGVSLLLVMIMVFLFSGCNGGTKENGEDTAVNSSQENSSNDIASEPVTEDPSDNGQTQATSADENIQEESSEPVQITIWHDKEETVAAVLQAELDKLAPGIVVNLVKKEGLTDALKLVGNDPNAAPDMYFFAHDKIGVYAEMGILSPITDFLPKDTFNDYIDVTVSAATYKGELYQLPIYYETLLFMYNKDLMSEDEVPATTEELYSYMKEHTDGERYGFVEQHSTPYYSVPWLHGFGAYIINDKREIGLQTPEAIKALSYHKKFVDLMPGESDYNTINILFFEGKAASIIGGPWLVPTIRNRGINLGFAPMPTVDETGLPLAPYSGTQGLHVLRLAAETKAVAITKVLKQLTGTGIGIAMAGASGCAPANSLCYEDESVKQDEMVMMMKATAENAVPMPNIPEMDVMWTVTGNMLTAINMSGGDPAEEAKTAEQEAKNLIAAMQ